MSRSLRAVAVAGALALGFTAGTAQALPFQNGSFELFTSGSSSDPFTTKGTGDTTITGWTVHVGSIDHIGSYWAADDGHWSIDLNGNAQGGIQQTFDTVVGQKYTVTFALAGNPDGQPDVKALLAFPDTVASDGGHFTFDASGISHGDMGWTEQSFDFIADAAATTLVFLSLDSGFYGPAIDNVRVAAVPEPATLAVLGIGLLGLGMTRRRKARKAYD